MSRHGAAVAPLEAKEHRRLGVRHDTRVRAPCPDGNERLTSSAGLVLVVLLAVETLTTLALRTYLSVHLFLGMLLLPPLALKLASTGWRFARRMRSAVKWWRHANASRTARCRR